MGLGLAAGRRVAEGDSSKCGTVISNFLIYRISRFPGRVRVRGHCGHIPIFVCGVAMTKHTQFEAGEHLWDRRELIGRAAALVGGTSLSVILQSTGWAAVPQTTEYGPFDAKGEAKKIAFDRTGSGEKVLLISGFPQTRRSWNRIVPLLSQQFETIPADLPSFGDSGILQAPATTENAGRVFHEFVAGLGTPLHVV